MHHVPSFLLALLVLPLLATLPATAQPVAAYEPPVPGAVLRSFAEPEEAYGPGHRGVDLVAGPGDPVRTAAAGEVTFAGTVAGRRWVTVRHRDGIRTSYGALDQVSVRAGRTVARGATIGTARGSHGDDLLRPEPGLHWSARRGSTYLDPLTLLDAPLPRPTLVGEGGWVGTDHVVEPYAPYEGGGRFGLLATPSPTAERPGYALPPNHHHLLQVPGYGTEGPREVLEPSYLGLGQDDSSVFSYRGCEPIPDGCDPRPYGGQDTDLTIDEAAALLDQQLRALQAAQPHRPVDLLGHSMGGDVVTHYLTDVYDPTEPDLPPIGAVGTYATPHGGSGTSSLLRSVSGDPILGRVFELSRLVADALGFDPAGRVSLGSRPLARYGAPIWGDRPARDPERLAELGIEPLEIAGSRDGVVGRTDAGSVGRADVLPGGHTSVTRTEAALETWYRHAGGQPPVEIVSRVGFGADLMSDGGRTVATIVDASPALSLVRALRAGDLAGAVWELSKRLVGGVGTDPDEPRRPEEVPAQAELPMAPAAPLVPADAAA